jgi:hypothetical protein
MSTTSRVGEIQKRAGGDVLDFALSAMPIFWKTTAEQLDRMARIGFFVWKSDIQGFREWLKEKIGAFETPPSTTYVAFFLAALAIENLLKGCVVIKHPEYLKDGELSREIKTHRLLDLASEADLTLSADEEDFCRIGTAAIEIFGRYPTGVKIVDCLAVIKIKDTAFGVYQAFYDRLVAVVDANPVVAPHTT